MLTSVTCAVLGGTWCTSPVLHRAERATLLLPSSAEFWKQGTCRPCGLVMNNMEQVQLVPLPRVLDVQRFAVAREQEVGRKMRSTGPMFVR